MNTNINKFSSKRMLRFMVADMYNRRVMLALLLSLAVLGTIILFTVMGNQQLKAYSNYSEISHPANHVIFQLSGIMWFLCSVGILVYVSTLFVSFFKRGFAAQNIMLPASRSEKFTSRILDMTIISLTLLAICWIISSIYGMCIGATISSLPFAQLNYADGVAVTALDYERILSLITTPLFMASIYFLGASFWRKLHFIKTSATVIVTILTYAFFELIVGPYNNDIVIIDEQWKYISLFISLGFISLAWLRFRRIQIKG